jgi:hypothetical protein
VLNGDAGYPLLIIRPHALVMSPTTVHGRGYTLARGRSIGCEFFVSTAVMISTPIWKN